MLNVTVSQEDLHEILGWSGYAFETSHIKHRWLVKEDSILVHQDAVMALSHATWILNDYLEASQRIYP